jgi:homoserine O-succinyltransferase
MAILVERRRPNRPVPAGRAGLQDRRTADICARGDCIEIGLVNNMPDAALEATELQFLGLLRSAAIGRMVRVRFFALPDVPRGDLGKRRLEIHYSDIGELWDSRLDALIVTGAEPRAASLADEPYWRTLTDLFDWAEQNTVASVWSCLAAHAAVLHIDGIERAPLGQKCSGVFACDRVSDHPIARRLPARLSVPHSRGNGLSEDELAASGYEMLTRSARVGPDAFLRQRRSLFLLFQGHPEYDADTLLREYRRDVGRFLRGERDGYPDMPSGCFNEQTAAAFAAFGARAMRERAATPIEAFPTPAIAAAASEAWHRPAARIYRNWLDYVAARHRRERHGAAAGSPLLARLNPARRRRRAGDGAAVPQG